MPISTKPTKRKQKEKRKINKFKSNAVASYEMILLQFLQLGMRENTDVIVANFVNWSGWLAQHNRLLL